MDLATLIGVLLSAAFVLGSMAVGAGLMSFFDVPSILIVFGGTIGATLISFPMNSVTNVAKVAIKAFVEKKESSVDLIKQVVHLSNLARREGLLSLEKELKTMENPFMRKGLQLAVDGTEQEKIQQILEIEISSLEDRHSSGNEILMAMSALAPAFGMVGTLMGLIGMLKSLEDPSQIGAGMAVALVTTFYGAVIANAVLIPLAKKLEVKSKAEVVVMSMVMEGIMAIQSGDNPRTLEEKLKSYIPPSERLLYDQQNEV